MTLEEFKKHLKDSGNYSESTLRQLEEVLNKYSTSDEITSEDKEKVRLLMQQEMAALQIAEQANSDAAELLERFGQEISDAAGDLSRELVEAENEVIAATSE